jgi:hypothetical protein
MVVQFEQPQTIGLASLSTRWLIFEQSGGHACSKEHIVPLDKFRSLGTTKLTCQKPWSKWKLSSDNFGSALGP